jgi:phospholipid/cholesterol/gamma-HCH transport system ATP-binding protein
VLLFDEPTAGLDPITATEIEEMILALQKKKKTTSIVVTHDLHGARTVADRLALIHEGKILVQGTFDELQQSDEPFAREFLRKGH